MHSRAKLLAVAVFSFFSSIGGAFAVPVDYDGPTYYQGTRDQPRQMCQQINGELYETNGKTRCYSIHRQALYICKDSGLCQIQKWTGTSGGSPMATGGGGDDPYEDSLSSSDSGSEVASGADDGSDGGDTGGDTGDSGGGTGDIFL